MNQNEQHNLSKYLISSRFFLIIAVLILLSIACNVPIIASQSGQEKLPGYVETSVVETMIAIVDDPMPDADDQTNGNGDPAPPTLTFTPEISDTPTLTPTVTDTPTPQVAMIYTSANTNCRGGQGVNFPWVVSIQAGEEAEAFGIDPTGEYPYWYIQRPDQPSEYCWLWGKYATPSGPYESLPVFTPMPTPTPGFDYKLTYINKGGPCWPGIFYTQYKVENIGAFTLESWKTKATDHSGGSDPQIVDSNVFYKYDDSCNQINTQNDLTPGEAHHVLMIFASDPSGHDISVTVRICQEDDIGGECLIKTYRHTP